MEFTRHDHSLRMLVITFNRSHACIIRDYTPRSLLLLVRTTYMNDVVLHAHPVRGESHNQRNTTGEVATMHTACVMYVFWAHASDFVMSCHFLMRLVWSAFK